MFPVGVNWARAEPQRQAVGFFMTRCCRRGSRTLGLYLRCQGPQLEIKAETIAELNWEGDKEAWSERSLLKQQHRIKHC